MADQSSDDIVSASRTTLDGFDIPHRDPFICEIEVADRHTSRVIPHVNNIEYLRWIDRVAELHADSLGYTRQWLLDHGVMWFVARHEIDYLAEAWPSDQLCIATWVRSIRKVKSWRDTLIVRPADSTIICRATTLWVLVDLETRRPSRISKIMRQHLSPFDPLADESHPTTGFSPDSQDHARG